MPKTKVKAPTKTQDTWQQKADEYLHGWQRTSADFENFRKRIEVEQAAWAKLAEASAMLRVTPILDDFRRAFAYLPADQAASAWLAGIRRIEEHLRQVLAEAGLQPIEGGERFDPSLHEAIAYEDHPELPDGSLIAVVEVGWKAGERVLKPAKVRVSRGQAATTINK